MSEEAGRCELGRSFLMNAILLRCAFHLLINSLDTIRCGLVARICRSHLTISADKAGVQFPASEICFCFGRLAFSFVVSMSASLLEMEGKSEYTSRIQ